MTTIVFIDTEATSLHPDGEIWEVGLIRRHSTTGDAEYRWLLPSDLDLADSISLDLGGFHERHPHGNDLRVDDAEVADPAVFARYFAQLTHRSTLWANNVAFDEPRLAALLRRHGAVPTWHYHACDIKSFAGGALGLEPPWDTGDLCARLGIDPIPDDERHTALGDARGVARMYDAVLALHAERGGS